MVGRLAALLAATTDAEWRVTRDPGAANPHDLEFVAHCRDDARRLLADPPRDLDAIAARCSRASPPPWRVSLESDRGTGGCNVILVGWDDDVPDLYLWDGPHLAADADFVFVAEARQLLPQLLP